MSALYVFPNEDSIDSVSSSSASIMPLAAKNILLSSKRKVGRPALARRALLRQPLASIT